jgi:hypothetical protein
VTAQERKNLRGIEASVWGDAYTENYDVDHQTWREARDAADAALKTYRAHKAAQREGG